ncbi:carbohydrate ABC transporter permease [Catellatospora tritici]|uniref:carbohydrate ABC transporter permease n=1 Tax=Catellatospora tritici TaxID=2851566 RepID=UPI001C2DCDD0|nr:sugar ABC transporter permease [Catellatospora tritici]MBV1851613.1 sugar ABC transporter permease [Catellatospora tritici]
MSLSAPPAPPQLVTPEHHRAPNSRRFRLSRWDIKYSPYIYVAPFFILFAVFGIYPVLQTARMALYDWNLIGDHTFTGLDNFTALMGDEYFWNAVKNTFGIFLLATIPQLLGALFLANLLNQQMRGRMFFRLMIVAPNVTSVAAVAIVFAVLFRRDFGLVNWVLGFFGVDAIDWKGETWSSWTAIATMVDWRWTGYNTLILLAAMQAIPKDIYESASLDGAGKWRQFWSITMPQLRPTLIFVVTVSTIGGLQLFTEPVIFGDGRILGGAQREFQTIAMYMYEKGFNDLQFGYGSAIAWALFIMIIIMSGVNYLLIRRSVK